MLLLLLAMDGQLVGIRSMSNNTTNCGESRRLFKCPFVVAQLFRHFHQKTQSPGQSTGQSSGCAIKKVFDKTNSPREQEEGTNPRGLCGVSLIRMSDLVFIDIDPMPMLNIVDLICTPGSSSWLLVTAMGLHTLLVNCQVRGRQPPNPI